MRTRMTVFPERMVCGLQRGPHRGDETRRGRRSQSLQGLSRGRSRAALRDFDPNVDGDPLAFVISMNVRRRHLDESRGDSKRRVSELSRRCILVRTYTGGHAIAIELDLMRPIAHRVAHRQREAAK
jgi:hypothetical protein